MSLDAIEDDFEFKTDGALHIEFLLVEAIQEEQSKGDSHNAYHCLVAAHARLECLDIAGPSTLSDAAGATYDVSYFNVDAQFLSLVNNTNVAIDFFMPDNVNGTNLFGVHPSTLDGCYDEKIVGDGIVNGFDSATLLAAQFRQVPYHTITDVSSTHTTTTGRSDTATNCGITSGVARNEYQIAIAASSCAFDPGLVTAAPPPSPTRRLLEVLPQALLPQALQPWARYGAVKTITTTAHPIGAYQPLGALVVEFGRTHMGAWYLFHIPGIVVSLELLLQGADAPQAIPLSYVRAPSLDDDSTWQPASPTEYELRYRRHQEVLGRDESHCNMLESSGFLSKAMRRNTIAVSQFQSEGRRMCGFDLVLYKPHEAVPRTTFAACEVAVLAGSSAIDGVRGRIQAASVCAQPYAGPAPHPPPPPPSPPPGPDEMSPLVWVVPVLAVLTALLVCSWTRAEPAVRRAVSRRRPVASVAPAQHEPHQETA